MVEESSKTIVLDIAGQVLRGEVSFDEALLVAHYWKVVPVFVNCLNSFGGGHYFDISEAESRIRSGTAQRAVDGKAPLFELPSRLKDHAFGKPMKEKAETERDNIERELNLLNNQAEQLSRNLRECEEEIARLEAEARHRPPGPNPWIGSVAVLASTFFVVLLVLVSSESLKIALGIFSAGVSVAGFVLFVELKKLRRFLNREERASRNRLERIKKSLRQIKRLNTDLEKLRKPAAEILENARMQPEEVLLEIRSAFPQLLPEESDRPSEDSMPSLCSDL